MRQLDKWAERAFRTQFDYGIHDCGLMIADLVEAITGRRVADEFRGPRSMLAAHRALRRYGGFSALCDERIGNRVNTIFSRRGDVHLALLGRHETLCVDWGRCVIVASTNGALAVSKGAVKIITTWRIE